MFFFPLNFTSCLFPEASGYGGIIRNSSEECFFAALAIVVTLQT